MAVLQAMQLGKTYNGTTALSDLNLAVDRSEIFCLLGQNGAGKTTTINLFLGFTEATSGKATIRGVEVRPGDTTTKQYVAYIPEVVQLYGNLTGIENLDFFSRLAGYRYTPEKLRDFLSKASLQCPARSTATSPSPTPSRKPWLRPSSSGRATTRNGIWKSS